MAFPGKKPVFKSKMGLCHISAETLNKIINMLDSLRIVMTDEEQNYADPATVNGDGTDWQIKIPSGLIIPTLPASGDYVLTSQDGDLSWVALEEFTCPGGS